MSMQKENMGMSLADALRDGATPEMLRESFEAALKESQNEVAAEQATKAKGESDPRCSGDCANCEYHVDNIEELDLDECREDLVYAVLDYLAALGILPDDFEVDEEDIDKLLESIEEVENEYKARMGFMRMMADIMKAGSGDGEKEKKSNADDVDDVIAKFLKSLK